MPFVAQKCKKHIHIYYKDCLMIMARNRGINAINQRHDMFTS